MANLGYIVTTGKMAEIIGKTEQRVNQLAKEGVLLKQAVGKWDLIENMKMYITFLENGRSGDEDLETQKLQAEVDYKRAKADTAKLELDELEGNMIRCEDVEAVMTDHVFEVRGMLMALPGRLAVDAAGATSAAEASEIIRIEVYKIMESLSNYKFDPEAYAQRVRDRQGWGELMSNELDEPVE